MTRPRVLNRAVLAVLATGSLVLTAAFSCQTPLPPSPSPRGDDTTAGGPGPLVVMGVPVGPGGVTLGVRTGWRQDRQGAEGAAAGFVEASGLVATTSVLARRDVLLALATPGYGPALVQVTNTRLDDLLFSMGQRGVTPAGLIWSEHALTVHATAVSGTEVEVKVWSVLILAVRTGSVPRQVWRTSTLKLKWVAGNWKVDRWSSDPGPMPAPPGEATVASVAAITDVTSWTRPSPGGAR